MVRVFHVEQRGDRLGHVIALFSRQPRVGRTTTAVNLSVLLARAGRRTALVHLDPESPATELLGNVEARPDLDYLPLALAPERSHVDLPAVQAALANARQTADLVVVDVPLLGDALEEELLVTTDEVIMLMAPAPRSLTWLAEGMARLTDLMASQRPKLEVRGLLMTFTDRRLEAYEKLMVQAERSFPIEVFPFCIPQETSPGGGGCQVERSPASRSARGYVELAMEVLHHE